MRHKPPILTLNEDASLKELLAGGVNAHLTQILPSHWCLAIERNGETRYVHLNSHHRIRATVSKVEAAPKRPRK